MSTLRNAYPEAWDEHERFRADRVALFVDAAVQAARAERKRHRAAWQIGISGPHGSVDLLRRIYPARVHSASHALLYVNKVRVGVSSNAYDATADTRDVLDLRVSSKHWRLRLPPPGLTVQEQEVYLRLRDDGTKEGRALELARLLRHG